MSSQQCTQVFVAPSLDEPSDNAWGKLTSQNPKHPDIRLTQDVFLIGRSSKECNVFFNYATISSQHVRIRKVVGSSCALSTAVIEDLSSNGTYLNGKRLKKGTAVPLLSGQRLSLVIPGPDVATKVDDSEVKENFISYLFEFLGRGSIPIGEPPIEQDLDAVFDVRDVLGSGHFATVKLAVHRKTGANVAIKIIDKRKFMLNPSLKIDHLRAEVEILKSLDHPNIIRLYDVYETERFLNLVMELVSGGDLFDRLVDVGAMTERQARKTFRQLLSALQYVHAQGVIHRDLKPENIFLASSSENADIKIGDFGLAKIVGSESVAQTFCGTPQYFAPEVLIQKGKKGGAGAKGYGKAVDMWSAGVILYILLSAKPPFYERTTPPTLQDQIRGAIFRYPESEWKHISAEAKDLIKGLLVVDPKKRLTVEGALDHPWMKMIDGGDEAAAAWSSNVELNSQYVIQASESYENEQRTKSHDNSSDDDDDNENDGDKKEQEEEEKHEETQTAAKRKATNGGTRGRKASGAASKRKRRNSGY